MFRSIPITFKMFSLLHAAQNKEGKQIHVFYFNWKKKIQKQQQQKNIPGRTQGNK